MARNREHQPEPGDTQGTTESAPSESTLNALLAAGAMTPPEPRPPVLEAEPVDGAAAAANADSQAKADAAAALYAEENRALAALPMATLQAAGVTNGMPRDEVIRRVTALLHR